MEKEETKAGQDMQEDLWQLFPEKRHAFWRQTIQNEERIQEIRIRLERPVIIRGREGEWYLDKNGNFTQEQEHAYKMEEAHMNELLCHICHDSPYAFEDELRQGFITVSGGHRVGIVGHAVLEEEKQLRTIKHISYMNIRIAHQIFGAAKQVLPHVYENGRLLNVLILSPPGCGKTTLLRELIRCISDGNRYGEGLQVGVVDERSELAGAYMGRAHNDLGIRTDVLDACPKAMGMMILLRAMSPEVIAVDELGGEEDMQALEKAGACGSRILATVHGASPEDVVQKFPELGRRRVFDRLVILNKKNGQPAVERVCGGEELEHAFTGWDHDHRRMSGTRFVVSESIYRQDPRAPQPEQYSGNVYE